jgi:hypothetical protein
LVGVKLSAVPVRLPEGADYPGIDHVVFKKVTKGLGRSGPKRQTKKWGPSRMSRGETSLIPNNAYI